MPGITKTWQREEGTVFDREQNTPDCIVLIDSSSSMVNPRRQLSYAVLGAGCACDAYLRKGARVAVYNFSDAAKGDKLILNYTTDREAIYRTLCRYLGGGTHLDTADIDALQIEPAVDIFMITDMQIANLDPVIDYFVGCPCRITAVHIGNSVHAGHFRSRVDLRTNMSIFTVTAAADIPKIILGRVRDYRRATSGRRTAAAGKPPDGRRLWAVSR